MSDNVRHLRPLRRVEPIGPSLDFALMDAVKAFDSGQYMAGVEALVKAIEIQHQGRHEQISSDRLNHHLRQIVGNEWTPGSAA